MKTMQEVQTLISDLQQFYTDVRLLDEAATGAAAATTAR